MVKKIIAKVKLNLLAGKATPAAPVGPAIGQHGISISAFCEEYNKLTVDKIGFIIPVEILIYEDKNYKLSFKTPPVSSLLIKILQIKKGSSLPNSKNIGSITKDQLKEIALIKLPDLNTSDINNAMKIIKGTARNMGISII